MDKKWNAYHFASLWIGLSISIPAFTISSSLIALGLSPWLAVLNVAIANLIVYGLIFLNSSPGAKYGISFPLLAKASFGGLGYYLPTLSRALVACIYNGILSWMGGKAIVTFIAIFAPNFQMTENAHFIGFTIFLFILGYFSFGGNQRMKVLMSLAGPILLIMSIGGFVWIYMLHQAAGLATADIMAVEANASLLKQSGGFWLVFLGGLTVNMTFWTAMALNISDFTQHAKSQASQIKGQFLVMPLMMTGCAFIGAYFAQASKLIFGESIFDPSQALMLLDNKFVTFLASFFIILATLTTSLAANVVAPAKIFSNFMPKKISYRSGVIITILLSVLVRPWLILNNEGDFVLVLLNIFTSLMAPLLAVILADYYIIKRANIDLSALAQDSKGAYWYYNGWNLQAIGAFVIGSSIPLLSNLNIFGQLLGLKWIAANSYFIGFVLSLVSYVLLMKYCPKTYDPA